MALTHETMKEVQQVRQSCLLVVTLCDSVLYGTKGSAAETPMLVRELRRLQPRLAVLLARLEAPP
jgi:hypothetical protein